MMMMMMMMTKSVIVSTLLIDDTVDFGGLQKVPIRNGLVLCKTTSPTKHSTSLFLSLGLSLNTMDGSSLIYNATPPPPSESLSCL